MPPPCTTISHHRQAAENSVIPPKAAVVLDQDLNFRLAGANHSSEWSNMIASRVAAAAQSGDLRVVAVEEAASMSQDRANLTQKQLADLGDAQSNALEDLQHLIPEVMELWQRVGVMLDDGSAKPGHPMRKAEYMTRSAGLDVLLRNATLNLETLHKLAEKVGDTQALDRLKAFEQAAETVNREKFRAVMFPEAADALKVDFATLRGYLPCTGTNLAAAITAVYSPLVAIRELLRAFLHEPSSGKEKLELLLEVIKAIGLDHLSLFCPLIGPAVAVAETLKKQEEKRTLELTTGVEERDRFLYLEEGIDAFEKDVDQSRETLAKSVAEAHRLDAAFAKSIHRAMGVFKIVDEITGSTEGA
jgi:hypothetical protein